MQVLQPLDYTVDNVAELIPYRDVKLPGRAAKIIRERSVVAVLL